MTLAITSPEKYTRFFRTQRNMKSPWGHVGMNDYLMFFVPATAMFSAVYAAYTNSESWRQAVAQWLKFSGYSTGR